MGCKEISHGGKDEHIHFVVVLIQKIQNAKIAIMVAISAVWKIWKR
jgi:hypothetical protein